MTGSGFSGDVGTEGAGVLGALSAISTIGSSSSTGGLLNPSFGLGAAALRGLGASSLRLQIEQARAQVVRDKIAAAGLTLNAFPAGSKPVLISTPSAKTIQAVAKLARTGIGIYNQIATARRARNVQKRAARTQLAIARAVGKGAPEATYQYVAQYGANNGPPISGSADDPSGQAYVRFGAGRLL